MNNSEVAHKWANQSGRNNAARGGHFYYEGDRIYSYGYHYVAGVLYPDRKIALVNSRRYSNSTARHVSYVSGALYGTDYRVHHVDNPAGVPADNVLAFLSLEGPLHRLMRARRLDTREYYRRTINGAVMAARAYADDFPEALKDRAARKALTTWEKKVETGAYFTGKEQAVYLASVKAENAAQRELDRERAARRAKEQEERARDRRENVEMWKAGADVHYNLWAPGDTVALRLKDGRVETSRGAQITARTARALWAGIQRGAALVGMSLDGYEVRAWDGERLVVGCHEIPRAELERVAALLTA
jgi:hypothetical protein